MTRHVLIDTDPGIDDAVALALAARLPSLRVAAITTVNGNVETRQGTRNARLIATREGLNVPVIAGADRPLVRPPHPAHDTHGPSGLGYVEPSAPAVDEPDDAADAMLAAAIGSPGLTLCCLGPLTNLAHLLRRAPEAASRLGAVVVMGGAIDVRGTQTEWSEFNWWSDPEAAEVVLAAGLDLRIVPLDITRRIAIPGSAIRQLGRTAEEDDDARFWWEALRFYSDFHQRHEQFDGAVVNDALAVALVADESLASWRRMRVAVSTSDDDHRGALIAGAPGGHWAQVGVDVRAREVIALIERLVFARWLPPGAMACGAEDAERWLAEHPLST